VTYLDDLAGDWAHTPGVVTLSHINAGGAETSGVKAHRDLTGPTRREVAGPWGISPTDAVWIVWADTLATISPDDVLVEADDTEWCVLSVETRSESEPGRTLAIQHRCVCRKRL
jgi:hypothetical protein